MFAVVVGTIQMHRARYRRRQRRFAREKALEAAEAEEEEEDEGDVKMPAWFTFVAWFSLIFWCVRHTCAMTSICKLRDKLTNLIPAKMRLVGGR